MTTKNSEILSKYWQKGSKSDETGRFTGEIEKTSINGIIMTIEAVENLVPGQIVYMNGNTVGVALERANALELVPVMMSGIYKIGGDVRWV